MTPDPNADLIGYAIPGVGVVTGTTAWSAQYVNVGNTVRVAKQVRRAKFIQEAV